jgi:hypothetical protein
VIIKTGEISARLDISDYAAKPEEVPNSTPIGIRERFLRYLVERKLTCRTSGGVERSRD